MNTKAIEDFFAHTPSLVQLTTQNGWPDPASLRIEVLAQQGETVLCSVHFDEVVMEGAGCVADRVACWGRYRLRVNGAGEVVAAALEAGARDGDAP